MDSLTQIVLGAAVGEATLGRKVGNRAMLWGGIAGTIPDLDVFANMSADPLSALAYHRAFTHSLVFGLLAAPILALIVHRLYGGRETVWRRPHPPREYAAAFLAFFLLILVGSTLMPIEVLQVPRIALTITVVTAGIVGLVALREYLRRKPSQNGNADLRGWTLLFAAAIVTHPLLDCFTAYGTQFLQPFDAVRIAWNTISVADPMYTLPFLLLLILAGRKVKGSKARKRLNRAGLLVSSAYLLFTVFNYFKVADILERSIADRNIAADEYVLGPTILNNVLWQATVREGADTYYFGMYSHLDRADRFANLAPIDGRHHLLANYRDTRELRILEWFSKGYMNFIPLDSGKIQVNDLRFGLFGEDPDDPDAYIFNWVIDTTQFPISVEQNDGPREDVDMGAVFGDLWERIKGIK